MNMLYFIFVSNLYKLNNIFLLKKKYLYFYNFYIKNYKNISIFFLVNNTYKYKPKALYSYANFNVPTLKQFSNYKHIYWVSKYLYYYLKIQTKIGIYWQFINLKLQNHKSNILFMWKLTYKKYILQNFFCSAWFYFFLIIQLYFFKNIDHISIFISKIIQKYHLKHHKKLFQIINQLFLYYLNFLFTKEKLKGYRLYFKGKLGRKGSVKKSTIYFKHGKVSYTNKSLRYNYKYFLIPTETGVIGCYLSVFF